MTPANIILDCTDELATFRKVVDSPELPTADIEVALVWIVEAVTVAESIDELHDVAATMSFGEALFSNANLQPNEKEEVWRSVVRLGESLRGRLRELRAYDHGVFPYGFNRLINNDTILLSKVRQGA